MSYSKKAVPVGTAFLFGEVKSLIEQGGKRINSIKE